MVQPSAPIIARFWPRDRSPSRRQSSRRSCRRSDRLLEALVIFRPRGHDLSPSCDTGAGQPRHRGGAFGPQEAVDLPDGREVKALRIGARGHFLLAAALEAREHFGFETMEIVVRRRLRASQW